MKYPTIKDWTTAICNNIRAKKNTTESINHQDIPSEINVVYDIGYQKGIKDTLDNYPLGVAGTFVPEEDTKTFSLSGLPFTPTSMMLICSEEVALGSNRTPNTLVCASVPKGLYGSMLYTDESGNRLGNVSPTTSVIQWDENGVSLFIPSSLETYLKKGTIYNYYITGGKA